MTLINALRERARHLKREAHALSLAARDPRTPWPAKFVVAVTVAYALSPIDLIPDFIPVLGLLDDLILVPLGLALALRLVPADVLAECRERAARAERERRTSSRVVAVLIVSFWIAGAALVVWRVCRRG